jgi:ferredoxin
MNWLWTCRIEHCTGCGICLDVCREDAIFMPRSQAYPSSIEGKCIGCMQCIQECPFDAIDVTKEPAAVS